MRLKVFARFQIIIAALAVVSLTASLGFGQDEKVLTQSKPVIDDKAEKIIQRGLEAVGGNRYLGVRTVIARGLFSQYKDGVPDVPSKFLDYVVYPDKERTEFTSQGVRLIQTNFGGKGWIFDG